MTDLPSSLGIEAVELLSEGGRNVTLRVTGRWRRRRPELRGQATLVVEAVGGRQRFLAMPEPPSLTGAAPGTWRMSFAVPASLAPELPGRTYLQLGGVMVPLPVGDVAAPPERRPELDPQLLEERRARSSELAAESARRRAAELAGQVQGLERDLADARAESERLRGVIADRVRAQRAAEQHAYAEQAVRADLEQDLARRTRTARHDLSVLHERVAELERELIRMRRTVDEAGHLVAAAEAARADAERQLAQRGTAPVVPAPPPVAPEAPPPAAPDPPPAVDGTRAERTRAELELYRAARGGPPVGASPRRGELAGDREALRVEARMVGWRGEPVDARVADLQRELAAAREEAAAQRRGSARAYEAIEHVRAELRQLRELSAPTAPTPPTAPAPPAAPPEPGDPQGAGPVQAEQLSAALARLREQAPAGPGPDDGETPPPQPAPPTGPIKPWMDDVFRKLCAEDAPAAGRLLLALLAAQRAADPKPVAYDLVVSDLLVAHVTVGSTAGYVEMDATARPLAEVDFQLLGDLASVARLLAAGPLRRRLTRVLPGRRLARVRGDRRRLAALDRLIGARLTVAELSAVGVKLDPVLAMTVAGLMIQPGWTAGERFVLGHQEPGAASADAYLHVRDDKPPLASGEAPHGPVETIVVCPADELLGVLAGAGDPAEVVGEQRSLTLLAQWLERAQCG